MKETDANRILNKNFKLLGFSHKISDPLGGSGIQNPFDGFSVYYGKPWYWETKFLKEYKAFSFRRIEEHQFTNLFQIKNELLEDCYSLIILGIYEPRKFFDFMFFDINFISACILSGKKSILKKELIALKEKEMFIPFKSDKEFKDYTYDTLNIDIRTKIIKNF